MGSNNAYLDMLHILPIDLLVYLISIHAASMAGLNSLQADPCRLRHYFSLIW